MEIMIVFIIIAVIAGTIGFLGRIYRLRLKRHLALNHPNLIDKYRISHLWFIYWSLHFFRIRLLKDKNYKNDLTLKNLLIKSIIYDSLFIIAILIVIIFPLIYFARYS